MGESELADDILSRSAADIVALYRSKQVSPVEVVTATLDRIDRFDRLYNAFVMIDREGALRDALASEERWRRGRTERTHRWIARNGQGPVLVKGMPTRRGSRTTNPVPSEEDSPSGAASFPGSSLRCQASSLFSRTRRGAATGVGGSRAKN